MKILFLCSWYRDTPSSTRGIFFAEQAAAVAEHGHDVAIACCSSQRSARQLRRFGHVSVSRQEPYSSSISGTVYRGETLVLPPEFRTLNFHLRRWQFSRFLGRVYADFGRPDIVHVQSALDAGILASSSLTKQKIPYVITEHATFYRRGIVPQWKKPLLDACFGNAFASFAVSASLVEDLRRIAISGDIGVLPNIYDCDLFNVSGVHRSGTFTFLMVCSLVAHKGVDNALRAFAEVHREHDDSRLLIAGDGPDRVELERLIGELGVRPAVRILGHQSRQDIARLMKQSHCIVSASSVETFGVTLIEGLACGLSAISTRSGGPEDFVIPPFGELVPTDSPGELAREMGNSIRNYDGSTEALESRNRYVRERFSKHAFYDRLSAVYGKIVQDSSAGGRSENSVRGSPS